MSSVINIDREAFFLGISPQILLTDYGPVALLDYKGGLECLHHVIYSRTATLEAHLLPEWGWQACCYTSRDEARAFWGSHHVRTLDLSKYLQERNTTHWNSVVFFKTCVLVVYNLGDSVCVHAPNLWRSQFVSSTSWSICSIYFLGAKVTTNMYAVPHSRPPWSYPGACAAHLNSPISIKVKWSCSVMSNSLQPRGL